MKTIAFAAILSVLSMSVATPWLTSAQPSGPSANGNYRFVLDDDLMKTLEFEATGDGQGAGTGRMTFTDEATILNHDVENEERPENPPAGFSMTADLNSLTIENNRALMGGVVRESSHASFIGNWVQLVVEDNGDGTEAPDKMTWRFCQPEPGGWIPQDAEDPRDEGAYYRWWVTDAERDDDRPVESANIMPGLRQSCQTYPLSNYEFPDARGEGQIQVLP